jgi:hypothetical protein
MTEFDAVPLTRAIAQFNEVNATKLFLVDPEIGDLHISGRFRLGDPNRFADMISRILPISASGGAGSDRTSQAAVTGRERAKGPIAEGPPVARNRTCRWGRPGFLRRLRRSLDAAKRQPIMATHSPIFMALPDAALYPCEAVEAMICPVQRPHPAGTCGRACRVMLQP